jgi:hypothetical protein
MGHPVDGALVSPGSGWPHRLMLPVEGIAPRVYKELTTLNTRPVKSIRSLPRVQVKTNLGEKETKILQTYYNSIITNLKFQHKPKYHLSKILI